MKKLLLVLTFILIAQCSLFIAHCHAQWIQTSGPTGVGAHVYSLVISDTNMYAGTAGGGVFLSTNNGAKWTAINNGLTNLQVMSLVLSGRNIFAGTSGGGIFLSTNNGTSWSTVNNGLTNPSLFVNVLAIKGANIFAGTVAGLYLSTNYGTSWTAINNGLTNNSDSIVFSLAMNEINAFAGTGGDGNLGGSVYLSTNNGAYWTAVKNGLTNSFVYSLAISGNNIFAGNGIGVFLSTNNGTSWIAVNNGLTNTGAVETLAISGTNIFAGFWGGVYLSINNGTSWAAVGLKDIDVNVIIINGDTVFAGTQEGVWKRALSEMVGINELKTPNSVLQTEIYPNPVNQLSTLNYQLSTKTHITIKIYDLTGREITTLLNETKDKGDYTLKYNTQGLKSGVYCVKVSTNNGIRVLKFVKE